MPNGGQMMEYHGFGERAADVLSSLQRVLEQDVSLLVPSHGEIIEQPQAAVEALRTNVEACLANYYSISAAQWYFAGVRPEWPADRTRLMSRLRPLPTWVREVGGTTRALIADTGEALLMDACGDIPDRVREQQQRTELGPIEAVWITHYHDDHVGSVNDLRAQQGCTVIAHETMADILRRPDAYLMPCIHPDPIAVDRVTRDGESWQWRDVKLTAYSFPGQTLYDAALLAEHDGQQVLFVGDSFGPGGVDDYCLQNRNLLGPGLGFDRCLARLQELPPGCLLVNPHVEEAFAFTRDELRQMRQAIAKRRELLRRLLDWEDPNYGLDPQWVRCDPYRQAVHPGDAVEWNVHIRNYSAGSRTAAVGLRAPDGWRVTTGEGTVRVPPGRERRSALAAAVPADAPVGRVVVGVTLRYGGRPLGEMAEAIVDVER
jgi:glyoxylase-like metal-dependent hydrolase (beta-lactamase superfamily II)